uniref:Retrotransposon gag domain-containing protein n=1 Tax=Kalanchoe fedtschenkoi TaxID=63787 RepID=A0A7N0ZSV2_KALFE
MEGLSKQLEDILAQLATINTTMATLTPLGPHVAQLAALPAIVNNLQASVTDGARQIQAVNLAVSRLGKARQPADNIELADNQDYGHNDGVLGRGPDQFSRSAHQPRPGGSGGVRGPYAEDSDDSRAPPRFHKIDFPMFDGKEDPLPWLNRCEQFFRGQCTSEDHKVWYASIHMTGVAQLWYYRLEMNSGEPSWRHFSQLVLKRFGPTMTDSPLGEIAMLRRTGTVNEYCNQFLTLACRDVELSEKQQVQLFITGLVNPLKTDVALHRPTTLDDAIISSMALEDYMANDGIFLQAHDDLDFQFAVLGASESSRKPLQSFPTIFGNFPGS